MLAIARGLVAKPKLLMIDEPSMGLAPVLIDSLVEQLAGIREQLGLTMLIVEQGMTLAADVCERIYVMTGGRIVAEVDSNVSAKEVLELYMGSAAMAADATAQSRSKSRVEEVGA
jgi:branched-chain amino acid transport system ATP-binding protein